MENYVQANIIPEVYSQLTMDKINQNLMLGSIAIELGLGQFKEEGDSVTFPKWICDGEVIDLKKGDQIPVSEMKQKSKKAFVKHKAFGRRIYDAVDKVILGTSITAVQEVNAMVFAKDIDKSLFEECLTTNLKVATAEKNKITADELLKGLNMYGDQRNVTDFEGIYIHSLLVDNFYKMDEFVRTDKTYNVGGNGIVTNNCIGYFVGIPVYLSDALMKDDELVTLIIKKNSLAKMTKKNIDVEVLRRPDFKATDLYTDTMYAVALINDVGVVALRKTITDPVTKTK